MNPIRTGVPNSPQPSSKASTELTGWGSSRTSAGFSPGSVASNSPRMAGSITK
jgi:hypothetical protein